MELGKCEMLAPFGALVNDDGDVMLIIDGYFPGEPVDSILYYNGGNDALLARYGGQLLVAHRLHDKVAEALETAEYVLVKENDTSYMYKAVISREDVSELIKQAYEERDYSVYTRHPYPLTTGAYELGRKICQACNKETAVFYCDDTNKEEPVTVCPACVWKTPRYKTKAPEKYLWPEHCGDEGIYLGSLLPSDISKEMWMEYLKNWNYEGNPYPRGKASELRAKLESGAAEAHLFKCTKCGKHYIYCIEL